MLQMTTFLFIFKCRLLLSASEKLWRVVFKTQLPRRAVRPQSGMITSLMSAVIWGIMSRCAGDENWCLSSFRATRNKWRRLVRKEVTLRISAKSVELASSRLSLYGSFRVPYVSQGHFDPSITTSASLWQPPEPKMYRIRWQIDVESGRYSSAVRWCTCCAVYIIFNDVFLCCRSLRICRYPLLA